MLKEDQKNGCVLTSVAGGSHLRGELAFDDRVVWAIAGRALGIASGVHPAFRRNVRIAEGWARTVRNGLAGAFIHVRFSILIIKRWQVSKLVGERPQRRDMLMQKVLGGAPKR